MAIKHLGNAFVVVEGTPERMGETFTVIAVQPARKRVRLHWARGGAEWVDATVFWGMVQNAAPSERAGFVNA